MALKWVEFVLTFLSFGEGADVLLPTAFTAELCLVKEPLLN